MGYTITTSGISNERTRSWRQDWLFALVLVTVTFLAYLPAWRGTPIWDDDSHLTKPELRSLEGLARIWTQPGATQQYYPQIVPVCPLVQGAKRDALPTVDEAALLRPQVGDIVRRMSFTVEVPDSVAEALHL